MATIEGWRCGKVRGEWSRARDACAGRAGGLLVVLTLLAVRRRRRHGSTRGSAATFETQEYVASRGLDTLEASSAYASGATGNGILVGVIDTGIDVDHQEFAVAIHRKSTDIVSGSAATLGGDEGHGTARVRDHGSRRPAENHPLDH